MSKLKIISLNVRGLGSSSKSRKIIQELNYSNCDIILLQETHVSCKKQAEEFEILWRGKCLWSFGTGRSAGVAILFSLNFPGKIIRFLTDSEGRILSLLIDYYNSKLNLVNIYSPNTISDRKSFFSCFFSFSVLGTPKGMRFQIENHRRGLDLRPSTFMEEIGQRLL